MEVSQGFLCCTFRALIHPRELFPLQTGQQLVLLYSVSELVFALVPLEEGDAVFEPPVIDKTCYSCMPVKRRPLTVIRVELISVCFVNQHRSQEIVFMREYKAIQNLVREILMILSNVNLRDVQMWVGLRQLLVTPVSGD